jgi:hypothetical protein
MSDDVMLTPDAVHCKRGALKGEKQVIVKITGSDSGLCWYNGFEDKKMAVFIYSNSRWAKSVTLGYWIKDEHFEVVQGKDIRNPAQ